EEYDQDEAADQRRHHVAEDGRRGASPALPGQEVDNQDLQDLERAVGQREQHEEAEVRTEERRLRRGERLEEGDAPGEREERQRERQPAERGAAADDADGGDRHDQRHERRDAAAEEIVQRSLHAKAASRVAGSEPTPPPTCIARWYDKRLYPTNCRQSALLRHIVALSMRWRAVAETAPGWLSRTGPVRRIGRIQREAAPWTSSTPSGRGSTWS